MEKQLIKNLEEYVTQLQNKFDAIQLTLNQFRSENEKGHPDAEEFLSNPLNCFSLIRRTYADWTNLKIFINRSVGQAQIDLTQKKLSKMPTDLDLEEAQAGLYSLQIAYDLKPSDMANGLLNGQQFNASLSTIDCHSMGFYFYNLENFNISIEWYYTAKQKYQSKYMKLSGILGVDLSDIWFGIAASLYASYKFEDALTAAETMVLHKPDDEEKLSYLNDMKHEMSLKLVCQGKLKAPKKFRCKYDTTSSPFLKLAPVKMEILDEKPFLVMYHDVISDLEISQLKQISEPMLKRGMVVGGKVNKDRVASAITMQTNISRVTKTVHQRITDITGMDLFGSDEIQIINYSPGGYYYNHVDYLSRIPVELQHLRNRKATLVFWLSDVEQGGATAFPMVQTGIFPRKGSAISWYHLDNAGDGDDFSLHAGCPVIFGSKWLAIQLIYESPQMFTMPCLPNKDLSKIRRRF